MLINVAVKSSSTEKFTVAVTIKKPDHGDPIMRARIAAWKKVYNLPDHALLATFQLQCVLDETMVIPGCEYSVETD